MGGNQCAVVSCRKTSHDNKGRPQRHGLSFHSVPTWRQHRGPHISRVTKKRRKAWMKALGIPMLRFGTIPISLKVCSRHFHSGQPADMLHEDDPDWVPSLYLKEEQELPTTDSASSPVTADTPNTRKKRPMTYAADLDDGLGDEEGLLDIEKDNQSSINLAPTGEEGVSETKRSKQLGSSASREVCTACVERLDRLNGLQAEAEELRYELECLRLGEAFLEGEEEWVRYYTGLHCLAILMGLLEHVRPHLSSHPDIDTSAPAAPEPLSPFRKLLLTLMRLKLDLPVPHLAHLLGVTSAEVTRAFNQTLTALYTHLQPLVYWPERACLLAATPQGWPVTLGGSLGRGRVVLVGECLELSIARPTSLRGRQQSYSSRRNGYAMKYLVASTAQGAVAFVSSATGARVTGLQLAERSLIPERLATGDFLLLVDRLNDEEVASDADLTSEKPPSKEPALLYVQVKGQPFGRGRRMLEVKKAGSEEERERWEGLRQPVGRVLEGLKSRYRLLDAMAPISSLLPASKPSNNISSSPEQLPPLLDQIVTVCCALFNLSPSINNQDDS